MKIGSPSFQGVSAYTEIPIAPTKFLYGQNSAGKSTVADAIEFLRHAFGGKGNWKKQLERQQ
jgi:predicted ATPase